MHGNAQPMGPKASWRTRPRCEHMLPRDDHKCGTAATRWRGADLLDQPQQRTPPVAVRRFQFTRPFLVLGPHGHLVAERLEFRVVDPVELHAKFEDGDRYEFGRLAAAACKKACPAFLKL